MEPSVAAPVANFTDLLLDAVCMVDIGGRFVFVSAASERVFGYAPQEMIGKAMIDFVAPADRARTLAAAQDIMDGKFHINFENRYLRKDGSIAHIMWSARWSEPDQLRVAVARDVTALKQAQAMQSVLYAIAEAAYASEDLAHLFQRTHAILVELLPAAAFGVALRDTAGQHLQFTYYAGHGTVPDASVMQLLCEEVVRRAAPLLLPAGTTEVLPARLQAAANAMTGGALAVPLTTSEGIIGAIVLGTETHDACDVVRERDLLLFVAHQLAAAIQRQRLHAHMRFMAMHDELTGLPNRRLFHDRFDTSLVRARRQQEGMSLLFIDLNGFKHVNDRHGHACGDRLLQQVARRIASCLRTTDTLARLGGDEFVVLLGNTAQSSDAAPVMDKIHLALVAPIEVGAASELQVAVSIGVAHYPEHGDDRQALMSHADQAMYAAKAIAAAAEAQA